MGEDQVVAQPDGSGRLGFHIVVEHCSRRVGAELRGADQLFATKSCSLHREEGA